LSRSLSQTLANVWVRYEGPTWLVALAVYAGWLALMLAHASLSWWIVVPAGAWLVAWHGSLQHETIDALTHVPRPLRSALAYPPLGVFFPFGTYAREHRQHHRAGAHVAERAWDPESFYHEPDLWARYPRFVQAIYRANQTLAGRLTIGVLIQTVHTAGHAARAIARGDRAAARDWAVHAVLTGALFWWLAAVAHLPWWQYVAFVAYPGAALTTLRSFYEHRYAADVAQRTVTVENRFPFGLLFLNNNYHVVHHADPALPWYRIPQLWESMRAAHIAGSGGFHFMGYGAIARRWLLRAVFEPVEERA